MTFLGESRADPRLQCTNSRLDNN